RTLRLRRLNPLSWMQKSSWGRFLLGSSDAAPGQTWGGEDERAYFGWWFPFCRPDPRSAGGRHSSGCERMSDWLFAHQEALVGNLWVGALALMMILEAFVPRGAYSASLGGRWLTHVALKGLGILLVRLCVPFAAFSIAVVAEQNGWGLLNLLTLPA